MCQSNVYTLDKGREELLMEEVAAVAVEGNLVTIRSLFGEPLSISARIKEIDLVKNRIVLEKTGS